MKRSQPSAEPPSDFLDKMRALLTEAEYEAFEASFDRPPRVGLRVNTLKISIPDFISISPFSLAPVGDWEPAGFIITDDSRPGRHPHHDAGLYYVQEPSAMVAAALLAPGPGDLVLDLSAAPGGKATHLASLMAQTTSAASLSPLRRALDAEGLLVANDVHAGRTRLLAENLARMGALNVLVTSDEPERVAAAFGPIFDRVLIDAPCSGEGMFRRREGIEWSENIVAACARRQQNILAVAPALVRPGGRLLYSTCTFSPEENEGVVAAFLGSRSDFALEEPRRYEGFDRGRPEWIDAPIDVVAQLRRTVRLWPQRFPGEGHFLALLNRDGMAYSDHNGGTQLFRRQPPSAEEERLWRIFARDTLAVDIPAERLHAHNSRLYLLPKTAISPGHLRIVRYGLLLGEARAGRFRPAHDLASSLAAADVPAAINWPADDPRLFAYLSGSDLPEADLPAGNDGWTLIAVDGFGLGWGKRAGGRLKNHHPHHLRRRVGQTWKPGSF
jgi:16S rRNA C967 or C1407 C5-methylase (RsmB/RsmF family)/NOL1/NOP2/fmu family ribosome biogenesis protein